MENAKKNQMLPKPRKNAIPGGHWLDTSTLALIFVGKTPDLAGLFLVAGQHPEVEVPQSRSGRRKVHQQVMTDPTLFVRGKDCIPFFVALYTKEQIERFNELRHKRWLRRGSRTTRSK
jgi:hypothetical protein